MRDQLVIERNLSNANSEKRTKQQPLATSVRTSTGKAISSSLLSKLKTQIAENEKQKYGFCVRVMQNGEKAGRREEKEGCPHETGHVGIGLVSQR